MRALMLCLVLSLALVFALCVLAGAGWVSYYRAAEQRDEYGAMLREDICIPKRGLKIETCYSQRTGKEICCPGAVK